MVKIHYMNIFSKKKNKGERECPVCHPVNMNCDLNVSAVQDLTQPGRTTCHIRFKSGHTNVCDAVAEIHSKCLLTPFPFAALDKCSLSI